MSAGGGNPAQRAARKRAGAREKDAERDPEAGGEERGTGSKVGGRRRGWRGGNGIREFPEFFRSFFSSHDAGLKNIRNFFPASVPLFFRES